MKTEQADVVIVGAGPSGLRAATDLAPQLSGNVLVLEREAVAGGVPRHCDHPGYGIRDLGRFLSGPAYARRLVGTAVDAGARIQTQSMVTGWADAKTLEVTSPQGRRLVRGEVIVLATGARERPRPARWVPGDRAAGVFTTAELQQQVHLEQLPVGSRAVVVGAELVSWSAAMTLRQAGVRTVAMVTRYPKADAYAVFSGPGRVLFGTPVLTSSRVSRVVGHGRVSGVEVTDERTGTTRLLDCDTVVFTGDWIPDHELARAAGIELDPQTLGPRVDASLRTLRDGVFAAGNVVHPVDTADIAALDGAHVAAGVLAHLRGESATTPAVPIVAEAPIRWVAPSLLRQGTAAPSRGKLLMWVEEYHALPRLVATQDGQVIGTVRLPWPASPGRVFRAPWSVLAKANPNGGEVRLGLA